MMKPPSDDKGCCCQADGHKGPHCPGWFVNVETDQIERCDECARFEWDEDAQEHVRKMLEMLGPQTIFWRDGVPTVLAVIELSPDTQLAIEQFTATVIEGIRAPGSAPVPIEESRKHASKMRSCAVDALTRLLLGNPETFDYSNRVDEAFEALKNGNG